MNNQLTQCPTPANMMRAELLWMSELPRELDGLPLHAAGNGNYLRFKGKSWLLYNYMDEDWWRFGSKSYAVSYDPKTHEEVERLELPCPGIDTATQDEAGNTYLSSGSYTGLLALYDMGPKPCLVKLNASGELEESWTTDLTDVTEGRPVSALEYARDGFAFVNVLHHERLGVKPDDKEIPAEVVESVSNDENWQVWLINLKDRTGRPLDEITGRMGQSAVQRIDGRAFLTVGYDDWSRTKLFELGDDDELKQVDDFRGEGVWLKLR